jgi:2-C-methyl-D-erythritol 4-phosphate cytidylyltransferase
MMETPQVCRKDLLLEGLSLAQKNKVEVTDEISALEFIGEKSIFHDPGYANPKVTTFEDYEYLRFLIKNENDTL